MSDVSANEKKHDDMMDHTDDQAHSGFEDSFAQPEIKADENGETEGLQHAFKIDDDMRAKRLGELREKYSGIRTLKITSDITPSAPAIEDEPEQAANDRGAQNVPGFDEAESYNNLSGLAEFAREGSKSKNLYTIGYALTLGWFVFSIIYLANVPGPESFAPQVIGAYIGGLFAPPALFWLIVSSLNRREDIHMYSAALRGELQSLLFPSEESAKVINKDVEILCKQAAEVSAASKAVLKSLHRARQGLREEMRDFSGVSKKAEFHIDRLAESLNERTGKLSDVIKEIEARTNEADEKAKFGAQMWEDVTQTILNRAGEMEAALGHGADKILEAASEAQTRTAQLRNNLQSSYDALSNGVQGAADKLEGLSERFDGHIHGLNGAAEKLSHETGLMDGVLQEQITKLDETTKVTHAAVQDSQIALEQTAGILDKSADNVLSKADRVTVSIRESVENFYAVVDKSVLRSEELGEKVSAQTNGLQNIVHNIGEETKRIEQAGEFAAHKLTEALSVAVSGAESLSAAVRRSVESLDKTAQEASDKSSLIVETTKQNIQDLQDVGAANLRGVKEIVEVMQTSAQRMETVSDATMTHVRELADTVNEQHAKLDVCADNLTARVGNIALALEQPLRQVNTAVNEADERHKQIEQTLRSRVEDMGIASERAIEKADEIRATMRGQAQEISTLAGEISSNAKIINDQMARQTESLGLQITQTVSSLSEVGASLHNESSKLGDLSAKAVSDIGGLRGEISARSQEITEFTDTAFGELRSIDETLAGKITILKQSADSAMSSVSQIKQALETTAHEIEPIYVKAIQGAATAHDRFEALKGSYHEATQTSLENLKQIGVVFEGQLGDLKQGAGEAFDVLKTASDVMQDRAHDIEDSSRKAGERMKDLSSSMQDLSSDIHLVADQSLLKIDNVQRAAYDQFHELSSSVTQVVSQLERAGQEFIGQAGKVSDVSGYAIEKIDAAAAKAIAESERLNDAAGETLQNTELLVTKLQGQADNLVLQANDSLIHLKKAGDSFAIRASEVDEQMKVSLQTSENYTKQLGTQAMIVAEAAGESADRLSKAVSIVTGQIDKMGTAAHDVTIEIEGTRKVLAEESDKLVTISSSALQAAKDVTSSFGKQSESLFKASQDAVNRAEEVKRLELRSQRDAFLGSAKFIVESLHSLSVDITRMLEGEVSEKTWKAFQKGDVSAFTRRLVQIGDHLEPEKATGKFESDTEFRTYVQRFIRQFEELYEQATEKDHGALLSSTFASSEVGKLYEFLCAVAGRTAKTKQETAAKVA